MQPWPDRRALDLFRIELPIIQAPMAGANLSAMAIAVSEAGGLGSIPGATLTAQQMRDELSNFRQQTKKPVNVNFFCHAPQPADASRDAAWKKKLEKYYTELKVDPAAPVTAANRAPFDDAMCAVVEEFKPDVVSFHFGLPDKTLLHRVKAAGSKVLGCATTVAEAVWLEQRGCDAIIAQGAEAGGHRGMFLTDDVATQAGTFALVPQVADAVEVPVIAAGGIADGRGIAAAFMLEAAAVQIGTAYLFCPEAIINPVYKKTLAQARDDNTVITNVFSGRPARGVASRLVREIGPLTDAAPVFPQAAAAIAPLKKAAEAAGRDDFTNIWSGEAARLSRSVPAGELTRQLAAEALERLHKL
jgi:nitronate monooxygenase